MFERFRQVTWMCGCSLTFVIVFVVVAGQLERDGAVRAGPALGARAAVHPVLEEALAVTGTTVGTTSCIYISYQYRSNLPRSAIQVLFNCLLKYAAITKKHRYIPKDSKTFCRKFNITTCTVTSTKSAETPTS